MDSEAAISVLNSRRDERNLDRQLEPKSSEYAFCSLFAAISKSLSDRLAISIHLVDRKMNNFETKWCPSIDFEV